MNGLLGGIGSGMVVGSSSSSAGNNLHQQQQPITSVSHINMVSLSSMPTNLHPMSTSGGFPNLPLPNINMPISMPSLTSINNMNMSPHHNHTGTHHAYTQHPHQHQHHNTGGGGGGQKPIRRRMRMITSCLECRRRKLKCNKCKPCVNCQKFNRECLYLGPKLDEASQMRLTEIKEQVGSLERALERDVAKGAASSSSSSRQRGGGFRMVGMGMGMRRGSCISLSHRDENGDGSGEEGELGEEGDEDGHDEGEEYAESTPFVTEDVAYDENETDDLIDLGIQVGKMRITERIGGMSRPRLAEEVSTLPTLSDSFGGKWEGKDANECLVMTDLGRYRKPSHGRELVHPGQP